MIRVGFAIVVLAGVGAFFWLQSPERIAKDSRAATAVETAPDHDLKRHWTPPSSEPAAALPRPSAPPPTASLDDLFGAPRHRPTQTSLTAFYHSLGSGSSRKPETALPALPDFPEELLSDAPLVPHPAPDVPAPARMNSRVQQDRSLAGDVTPEIRTADAQPSPAAATPAQITPALTVPAQTTPAPTPPAISVSPAPQSAPADPSLSPAPATQSGPVLKSSATGPALGAPSAGPPQEVALFNGEDLTGWQVHEGKPDGWKVQDGVIRCVRPDAGWLRTDAEYGSFDLRFEYRLTSGANTGVGLRFAPSGSPTFTGVEVQLIDDAHPKYADLRPDQHTGSLYYRAAPQTLVQPAVGEWHECRIVATGMQVQVAINGQLVTDVKLDPANPAGGERPPLRPFGSIGFQSSSSPVEFRHIRLRDLFRPGPEGLRYADLVTGQGDVCTGQGGVTVDYRGWLADGVEFDGTTDRGHPVAISLDKAIAGWRLGLAGMRVGGRRQLVIPAALAYGDRGVPDRIPPGATLVFEVELRGVEH